MKNVLFPILSLFACAVRADVPADVSVRALPGAGVAFRRSVIGVNHLAYGRDGYGLLLPGRHTPDPDLVALQKEIGFGSLRYPGGCGGTHPFDWKRNAGLGGDYRVLGVVEFMDMCEKVGAEPILGISSHRGTPEEAAAYVEFLNAPADDAHPWAKKRAARGRLAPYGARDFEYGNETYHGTHPRKGEPQRRITPEDYADSYLKFAAAMKAADPKIRLGAVLSGEGSGWNRRVLARLGKTADFFVRHTYCGMPERTTDADFLTLFTDRRRGLEKMLAGQVAEIGRADAQLAITEFNTTIAHHRTLAAALVNLETLMALAADPHVAHADYWQFVNEGFGMVRGSRGAFVKRPNAWAFELFSRYTLDTLLPVAVDDREVAARPKAALDPEIAAVLGRNFAEGLKFSYPGTKGSVHKGTGTSYVRHPDGEHELRFNENRAMNFYHLQARVGALPKGNRCNWRVSCKMRVEGMKGEDLNLDVTDGRGWTATHSAAALPAVNSPDWIEVAAVYSPLIDNPGSLVIRFRRDGAAATGAAFVRDLRVEAVAKEEPRASPVTGQLSVAADGRTAALILMNRSLAPREVSFDLGGVAGFAGRDVETKAEALTGPSAYATNEENPNAVRLAAFDAAVRGGVLRTTLPPHAAVGFRFTVAAPDWRPVRRWVGFNLLGMFRAPTIGLAPDPRVDGHFVEWEFQALRDWGFNFARLPIDYRTLVSGDSWTNLDAKAVAKVDQAIAWGRKYGIHVQVALHRIPGYCILDQTEAFPLGTSPFAQEAACELWRRLARRWKGIPNECLSFNLFNEPTRHVTGANYLKVARQLIAAIRAEDPDRFIMADGDACASKPVPELYGVRSVGQAFRGYTPHAITHYLSGYAGGNAREPPTWPLKAGYASKGNSQTPEETVALYQDALDAGECCMVGEFGCRNRTPHAVALAWMEHCLKLWNAKNLGWALWNLRGHNGILDSGRDDVAYEDYLGHRLDRKMLDLLRRYAGTDNARPAPQSP